MKITLDVNVFISGIICPENNCGKIVRSWENGDFVLCISEEIITELERVLQYKKIQKQAKWDMEKITNYSTNIRTLSRMVNILGSDISVPKDKNDNHILATFIIGKCDYLISGDEDLLSLKKKYKILTPKEFVDEFL